MRTMRKDKLNQADEVYRLILTMLKKLKLSKKEDRLIIAEATSDIVWLSKIMEYKPFKYSIILQDEEASKLIFFRDRDRLHFHDLYVNPKYRKKGISKMLIVEALSDNRDLPMVTFHTRESNKPIHNLTTFFIRQFTIPIDSVKMETVPSFYIDGGQAVLYTVPNPANFLDREANEIGKTMDEREMIEEVN